MHGASKPPTGRNEVVWLGTANLRFGLGRDFGLYWGVFGLGRDLGRDLLVCFLLCF